MEDRLQPKTAPQCTREPYTAGVLEAPAGYSGQAARTGRTVFMSGPVFGGRSQRQESQHEGVVDDYPEDLKRVQQRYDRRWIALSLTLMLFGIAVSWIVVGVGWYGLLAALPAIVLASWVLGRFGGPTDPKWKSVRDDWTR